MSGLDLYATQRTLALMFVYATLLGFALGGVYDALRVLRVICGDRLTPQEGQGSNRPLRLKLLLFAEDVLFMLVASVALILLCYYTNDGQLRAPATLGMACGFFVYMQTVARLTRKLAEPAVRRVKSLLKLLLSPLWHPARWLYRKGKGAAGKLRQRLRDRRAARKKQQETDAQVGADAGIEEQTPSPASAENSSPSA